MSALNIERCIDGIPNGEIPVVLTSGDEETFFLNEKYVVIKCDETTKNENVGIIFFSSDFDILIYVTKDNYTKLFGKSPLLLDKSEYIVEKNNPTKKELENGLSTLRISYVGK